MKEFDPYDETTRRTVAGMQEAEATALARRESGQKLSPTSRRRFLGGVAAAAGGGAAAMIARTAGAASPGAVDYPVQKDPTKVQGRATNDDGGYGSRSQFEDEVRWRFPTATKETAWTMTPLDAGNGIITPSGLHFERHHGGIPNIAPEKHALIVHGMVNSPKKYTMGDLKRFPSVSLFHFIECSGNGLTEWRGPNLKTVQGTHGLT
ncbi:MAG: molybdopterin-dependent oxidoreductase, partial [Gammaproteobacteria bacterium]